MENLLSALCSVIAALLTMVAAITNVVYVFICLYGKRRNDGSD